MSSKTVIPIDRLRNSYRQTSSREETNLGPATGEWTKKQPESVGTTKIAWEALYPTEDITDPRIIGVQRLLGQTIDRLEMASKEADQDPIVADDYVQSTQPLLAELFSCRAVGEGFAAVVNAVSISLLNQHGEPLDPKQIRLILRSLKELKSHLFIGYDAALRTLREYKKVGLRIFPNALQHLDLEHD